jgi:hypothetical protein
LGFAGAGALLASWLIETTDNSLGEGLANIFYLIIIDIVLFIIAIIVAALLSKKIGYSISGDQNYTNKQVKTILFALVGIGFGLGTWIQAAKSPKPSIVLPIIVATVVQITFYLFASQMVFATSDMTRKKVWTPIVFFIMLVLPSAILYKFAQ